MKNILCFLVLAGLVALISAAPEDKPDAAKAAADAAKTAADAADKDKKAAEDAANKLKDATDAPEKAAKAIADGAKKAVTDPEKEVEKDCPKPHDGKGLGAGLKLIAAPFIAVEKAAETFIDTLFDWYE